MDRRRFLKNSAFGATAAASLLSLEQVAKASASERVRVGIMGAGGRALSLINTFARNSQAAIVAIADIDSRRFPHALETVNTIEGEKPRAEHAFRTLIDAPPIDARVRAVTVRHG